MAGCLIAELKNSCLLPRKHSRVSRNSRQVQIQALQSWVLQSSSSREEPSRGRVDQRTSDLPPSWLKRLPIPTRKHMLAESVKLSGCVAALPASSELQKHQSTTESHLRLMSGRLQSRNPWLVVWMKCSRVHMERRWVRYVYRHDWSSHGAWADGNVRYQAGM